MASALQTKFMESDVQADEDVARTVKSVERRVTLTAVESDFDETDEDDGWEATLAFEEDGEYDDEERCELYMSHDGIVE